MTTAQYFDLQTEQVNGHPEGAHSGGNTGLPMGVGTPLFRSGKVPGETNRYGQVMPIQVRLDEVMFTSRVPLSTWTFAFAIKDKLWVSSLTTLYFGKRTTFKKTIYRGRLFVPESGSKLEIGITAYNSYGDTFNTTRQLCVYSNNMAGDTGELIRLDEDWTQLLFKFHVHTER